MKNIEYNTVLHGTGNNSWGFLFPQFNPSQGTLIAVSIRATISLGYGFSLENNSGSPVAYHVNIYRRDSISSNELSLPIYNSNSFDFGPYDLSASDGIAGSGPDYVSQGKTMLLNNYFIHDSIANDVAPFMGTNFALFNYSPATVASISGGPSYDFASSANDTLQFSLTYYYCSSVALPATITEFEASNQNDKTIRLSWTTENELESRVYVIQKSVDGIHFIETDTIRSVTEAVSSRYSNDYLIPISDQDRIYFRLMIIDAGGAVSYSLIRIVELHDNSRGISLYPNPANRFIRVIFNMVSSNWQTEIFADNGQLVQRNYFSNTNSAQIRFVDELPSGLYFIRAINTDSQKSDVTSFIIK